jgi:sugar phosphate permease
VIVNPASWPPVLTSAGIYSTLLTFVGLWGVPYLVQVYGVSRVAASGYTAWAAVGILVGAISIGWLSDRVLVRRRLPLIVFAAIYAALWYALAIPDERRLPLAWLVPLCFLLGLTSSVVAVVFAAVPEVNDPRRPGVAIGFCNIPSFTAIALLQWGTGAILDAGFAGEMVDGVRVYPFAAYRAVFVLCAALATGAVVAAFGVTETHCRNVWAGAVSGARR